MSNRGERELECLYTVKKDIILEPNMHTFWFGTTNEDIKNVKAAFSQAVPNHNANNFPDFICNNAIIEHFQITSSKETARGSKCEQTHRSFERETVAKTEEIKDFYYERKLPPEGVLFRFDEDSVQHSHDFLKDSFKRCWNKHSASLKKYTGDRKLTIFLVEYQDRALLMAEQTHGNISADVFFSYELRFPNSLFYRISCDKELLTWIQSNSNGVDFVVFRGYDKKDNEIVDRIEIVSVSHIAEMLSFLPWKIEIYSSSPRISNLLFGWSNEIR